jgi:hypothetical protein
MLTRMYRPFIIITDHIFDALVTNHSQCNVNVSIIATFSLTLLSVFFIHYRSRHLQCITCTISNTFEKTKNTQSTGTSTNGVQMEYK